MQLNRRREKRWECRQTIWRAIQLILLLTRSLQTPCLTTFHVIKKHKYNCTNTWTLPEKWQKLIDKTSYKYHIATKNTAPNLCIFHRNSNPCSIANFAELMEPIIGLSFRLKIREQSNQHHIDLDRKCVSPKRMQSPRCSGWKAWDQIKSKGHRLSSKPQKWTAGSNSVPPTEISTQ